MVWINGSVVCFLTLSVLWTFVRGDAEVSCVVTESCILPCSFQVDSEAVIHWIQVKAGHPHVHSYFHNQDQLARQDQRFRGRTSLFKDQISRGNASLQLTRGGLQDQSRYKCITSTTRGNKESFINLKVDAPVTKVDIQQVENRITCSSEGIYPEPELTWSTNPPSNVTLQNKTTVHQTEQQFYNINSSLIVSVADLDYSCTVSTHRNRRRATLRQLPSVTGSSSETTILCTASNTSLTRLIWRFNHSQIILKQTRANVPYTVSEEWRQQVKSVSESGSLTLQHISSNQEGIYTCELSDDEETYVTNTLLMIEEGFPRVIGAIDCTHIPISAPLGEHEGDFVNRKSQYTINVQMTCDHQYMITSVDARWPGSVHDARIFRESLLSQRFQEGRFDGILLGDRGYPCLKHLMTPFADPQSRAQRAFNHAHSITRVRIENTFGILKARFSCLKGLRVKPERACQTIAACVVLHNIATIRRERVPNHDPFPPDVTDPMTLDHPTGCAVRDAIANQFFNQ